VASPQHLAIGPYPARYETWAETRTGYKLFIRPIKPEDAGLILEMFSNMSSQSVHQRFLRPVEALSQDTLIRFTQIDYDRELALVALDESGPRPVMVGVTRLVSDPDGQKAVWTLAVGDPWQDQGVGALLVEKAFAAARSRGIRCLWGNLLASNTRMIALHQKFGSQLRPVGDGSIIRATHYLDPEPEGGPGPGDDA
jgi:acetyltransferase